ncbi:MAG TPA: hypothetical protein VIF43_03465 [Patescibacteria group bacterium]
MRHIAVAPLAVSRQDTYTYRTDAELAAGSIVSIPYAGRRSEGVVIGPAEVDSRAKEAEGTGDRLPDWQLGFGRALAEAYLSPLGQTFALLLPKWRGDLPDDNRSDHRPDIEARTEVSDEDLGRPRMLTLVPERVMLRRFAGTGLCFSATMPIPKRRETWQEVRNGSVGPVFGTRSALFLPWKRLERIIVLHEDELGHQNDRTPRFHAREAARLLAESLGAKLTLASPAPSLRAWDLAGRPDIALPGIPTPTVVTPRYERLEDPVPYGFLEKLEGLDGTTLVHTTQAKVAAVKDTLKHSSTSATVGGQASVLAEKRYDHVITLGIDAILARPGYAVTERAVALLRKLGEVARPGGTFLVYSKYGDHPAFDALGKSYETFLREEFRDREVLGLPPANPLVRVVTTCKDRPRVERVLDGACIGGRAVRFAEDGDVLTVLIKGDPRALRTLVAPERRISVEY